MSFKIKNIKLGKKKQFLNDIKQSLNIKFHLK